MSTDGKTAVVLVTKTVHLDAYVYNYNEATGKKRLTSTKRVTERVNTDTGVRFADGKTILGVKQKLEQ